VGERVTLTPSTIPGKYFSTAQGFHGYVLERHDEITYHCDQLTSTIGAGGKELVIPRLLGINLLRECRFYDDPNDARRAGWDVLVWNRGEEMAA
jgi:hypothetical protein